MLKSQYIFKNFISFIFNWSVYPLISSTKSGPQPELDARLGWTQISSAIIEYFSTAAGCICLFFLLWIWKFITHYSRANGSAGGSIGCVVISSSKWANRIFPLNSQGFSLWNYPGQPWKIPIVQAIQHNHRQWSKCFIWLLWFMDVSMTEANSNNASFQ